MLTFCATKYAQLQFVTCSSLRHPLTSRLKSLSSQTLVHHKTCSNQYSTVCCLFCRSPPCSTAFPASSSSSLLSIRAAYSSSHSSSLQLKRCVACCYSSATSVDSPRSKTPSQPIRITLVGAPGSGKGTQASSLTADFGIQAVSSGDALRAEVNERTDLGKEIESTLAAGKLVSDDILAKVIENILRRPEFVEKGWILDGYPRTIEQAHDLSRLLTRIQQPLTQVFFLDVDEKEIINRIAGRWIHDPSGRVYNVKYNPPRVPMLDDVTGEPLSQRPDDRPEVVEERLRQFREMTLPLLGFYKEQGLLTTIRAPTSAKGYPMIKSRIEELLTEE